MEVTGGSVEEREDEKLPQKAEDSNTSASAEGTHTSLSNNHCISVFRLLLHFRI